MLKTFPKKHLIAAGTLSAVVGLAFMASPGDPAEAGRTSISLNQADARPDEVKQTEAAPPPVTAAEPIHQDTSAPTEEPKEIAKANPPAQETSPTAQTSVEPQLEWQRFTIKSGDSLTTLFKKAGFDSGLMFSVIHGDGDASQLERLYAGESIGFAQDGNGELQQVKLTRNRLESLLIERQGDGFTGTILKREPEPRPVYRHGVIDDSLYLSARDAGLNDRLTMEMADIFGWNIDFVYDIRKGDKFEVLYQDLYLDDKRIDTGDILAAKFINRGKETVALRYTDKNGDTDYYTPDGHSLRKAILRTPINARVSSPFNLQRRHPVLGVVRPHEGTDYAAPPGTPIKAAGNGRIVSAGWKGGYGRAVVIQHGDNISTLYAHMRAIAKGIRSGVRVKQGQTIGYLGSSGLATGPHLHYEFRINGKPRNSRTVKLPDASPVPKAEMARFQAQTQTLLTALNEARGERQIALGPESE
ncbi:peptidase M23 [Marinobacter halodurans]|uniref:Peptidase M23 n=1 Tax=Marinobacter halodurans TaxID=2528979 RepID=A0ABY1ZFD5_9GAMM|nr:peptidoglycan DD-metalloendopeptidase family protein [Marinobacter halodurans]TBW49657.1 peptidase M23 [Marinobacter halodurans]